MSKKDKNSPKKDFKISNKKFNLILKYDENVL